MHCIRGRLLAAYKRMHKHVTDVYTRPWRGYFSVIGYASTRRITRAILTQSLHRQGGARMQRGCRVWLAQLVLQRAIRRYEVGIGGAHGCLVYDPVLILI